MGTIRKNQMELREIKNSITEVKNAFTRLISRLDKKDERHGELADISIEITQIEQKRENRVGRKKKLSKNCGKYQIILTHTMNISTLYFYNTYTTPYIHH